MFKSMDLLVKAPPCLSQLGGRVRPPGSKSLSNRILLMEALAEVDCQMVNLSSAKDTSTLWRLLRHPKERLFDAGDAGTTFRFLTAFLALRPEKQILTGTPRMLQRPIGPLVQALQKLGAKIEYLGQEGYPPLMINKGRFEQAQTLKIDASLSSQYTSALLMIAPRLPGGLKLSIEGSVVSLPYIEMTLGLMQQFGIHYRQTGLQWQIPEQRYRMPESLQIEGDWSAASYFYLLAAFCPKVELQLDGLFPHSLQGDAQIAELMRPFGIETRFNDSGLVLLRNQVKQPLSLEVDCLKFPDLAPTLAVLGAGLNIPTQLKGLQTLKIKECDRIEALASSLQSLGAKVETSQDSLTIHQGINPQAKPQQALPTFDDHRMAMSLAGLSLVLGQIPLQHSQVVQKSYPQFWQDLVSLGLEIKNL